MAGISSLRIRLLRKSGTLTFQRLLMKQAVTYGTLDMRAFGMRDPNGYYYYKPTSLLHSFPHGTLDPVCKRCSNKSNVGNLHQHQPLEGSAPGYGSRTKLAQVYPYKFCSVLILRGVQKQVADFSAVEHSFFASDVLHDHGLPMPYYYTRRLLNRTNALPTGNVYHPVQIEAHEGVSQAGQMYSSTSPFDNAAILRGSFQALRVNYRHTNGKLLLWKKKDTSQLFLRHHPKDLSNLISSHWSTILFYNADGWFRAIQS